MARRSRQAYRRMSLFRIKQETQDGILLYQVGDFFEMYGEDARIAAEALDLNLTSAPFPALAAWKCAVSRLIAWSSM